MTYSIVARDQRTGQLGVAVQSRWFSVGSVVTWGAAGVGVVATQSFAEPRYGVRGLALMRLGVAAGTALQALVSADPLRDRRQVAFLDADGVAAQHTGARCIPYAGHAAGDGVATQANLMRSTEVWPAMLEGFAGSDGELSDRLLAALDAGERAGGDVRGRQSAAMLIVEGAGSGQEWTEPLVDVRVEDSPDPLGELRRLVAVHRAYQRMGAAENRSVSGDLAGALELYESARRLAPDNDEAEFWSAIFMAELGRVDEGRALLRRVVEREPGWAELLRRLPETGFMPGGEGTVRTLLDT